MNRKILLAAAGAVAALSLAAGSLSYFTAKADVTNVVTMGNVQCKLDEPDFRCTYGGGNAPAMPGTKINKDPTVENTSDNKAWLFVEAEILWDGEAPKDAVLPTFNDLGITANTNFTAHGLATSHALFAYNGVFSKGPGVEVFKPTGRGSGEYTMTIPTTWENEYEKASIKIVVTAHVVQYDNIATQADAATALKLSTLFAQA